jgi:hypothetical protein
VVRLSTDPDSLQQQLSSFVMSQIVVAALYRFVPLNDFRELKQPIEDEMKAAGVRGTLQWNGRR